MRRFSQRSHLVTLSEINITPLLDLAFVLLIIFIITTPLLEQGIQMTLPQGGQPDRQLKREDIRALDITRAGYLLDGRPMDLAGIQRQLVNDHRGNPNLTLYLRADRTTPWDWIIPVMDLCVNNGISISPRTEPPASR